MSWDAKKVSLADENRFDTLNGLWTGKKPAFVTAGVIRNTNFTASGRIDYSDVAWLQVEQKQLAKRQLKPGDIIVERSGGGPKQPVGRVVYFAREDGLFSFSNFTSAIRVRDTEAFDARFIFYGLLELYQSGRTEDIQRRTTGIRNLDFTAYKERASFPQISLPEQRKIVAVLGLVQRAIEQQERLLALTTELKKTLLHQLFTQGLRGEQQKQTEIGLVPESWEVVELINAVEQIDYGISAPIPKTSPENGVKIVSTADITKDCRLLYDQIRQIEAPEKTVKRLILRTGDVLFNWRNSAELIGKSAVFQEQAEPHIFASFILRIKCGEKKSHNFFVAHLMNHFREEGAFLKLARRAVNQANFNRNEISVLKIPLPDYREQRDIADAIGVLDAKIHHHRQKKAKLTELFRTCLWQLMTAQIRVKDLALPDLEAEL